MYLLCCVSWARRTRTITNTRNVQIVHTIIYAFGTGAHNHHKPYNYFSLVPAIVVHRSRFRFVTHSLFCTLFCSSFISALCVCFLPSAFHYFKLLRLFCSHLYSIYMHKDSSVLLVNENERISERNREENGVIRQR